jgi:hypothetical protein
MTLLQDILLLYFRQQNQLHPRVEHYMQFMSLIIHTKSLNARPTRIGEEVKSLLV